MFCTDTLEHGLKHKSLDVKCHTFLLGRVSPHSLNMWYLCVVGASLSIPCVKHHYSLGKCMHLVSSRIDQTGAYLLWLRLELGGNELMESGLSHFSLPFPSLSYIFRAVRRGWAKHSCSGCVVSVAELTWPGDPSNMLFLSFPEQEAPILHT